MVEWSFSDMDVMMSDLLMAFQRAFSAKLRRMCSLAFLAAASSVSAQECAHCDSMLEPLACDSMLFANCSCDDNSMWARPYLLGDPGGLRSQLVDNGFTFNISSTQFYQGVTSGGIDRQFQYGGRNDYYLNIDGEKAGLWQGLFVTLHGESRYGESVNSGTGALLPPNGALLFPTTKGTATSLTGVKITQALSENFALFAGKINTLDELVQPFASGRGVDAFMNTGLMFPAASARTVPYSTLGAGFAILQDLQPVFTVMVLDTHDNPTNSGFDELFTNGATTLVNLNVPVTLAGLPGHQGLWGTYSTGKYNDLDPTVYIDPNNGLAVAFGQQTGSWAAYYSADQALYVDPCNAKRSFGLFTNIGFADNGPSPIHFAANVGLGGSSPLHTRPLDTFGIGYSYVGYSDPVKSLAPVLLPTDDDQVVELFYNYAVTPWFRITPDLQVVMPARERTLPPNAQDIDTSLVVGLRGKIIF